MKLKDIADFLNGEFFGDPELEITGAAGIPDASPGDVTFLSSSARLKELIACKASAVLVESQIPEIEFAQIKVKQPQYGFARMLEHFYVKPETKRGVSPFAFISETAELGEGVNIDPFAFISKGVKIGSNSTIYPGVFIGENTVLGSGCILFPNVTVRENIVIGNNVVIHSGTVIGADGFGYVFAEGSHRKIPQIGGVIIEDDVEIGACSAVDRATTGNTVIGSGTKIDNLVQVAHNVTLGKKVILVAQSGVAGSSEIGDGVMIGGHSGIADHTKIAAGTMIGGMSGAFGEIKRGVYSGLPVIPHRDWLRSSLVFARLPELEKRLKLLEEKSGLLEAKHEVPKDGTKEEI